MTDRQIDTKSKSGCWSITSFDPTEQNNLINPNPNDGYPDFVREVYGGLEECPRTKRIHFQGCLITKHIRFSQVKKWLPRSHIERAIKKEALIKYAMKQETSIGEKRKSVNDRPYFSMEKSLELLGKYFFYSWLEEDGEDQTKGKRLSYDDKMLASNENYWKVVNTILYGRPYLISVYSNPQTLRSWRHTYSVWCRAFWEQSDQEKEEWYENEVKLNWKLV